MISKKELSYVDTWATKVPYPGKEYSEQAMKELTYCLDLFKREYLNRIYNVTFSNNEEIEFQILNKNICHMLGVDFKNLSGDYFSVFRNEILGISSTSAISSYSLINAIVDNQDKILEQDEYRKAAKAINYYRVAIKCSIFKRLADLSAFNYGCINFNKDIYNEKYPNRPFSSNATRFMYTPSDEVISPYYMMGLKNDSQSSDEDKDKFIVETLMSPESCSRFFDGQEVVIPTQIITDNNGILQKNQATPAEKIKLLKDYKSLIDSFGLKSSINVYGDYLSQLMQAEDHKDKQLILK